MYRIVKGPELTVTQLQKIQQVLPHAVNPWVYQREWYFSSQGAFLGMWR